MRIIVLFPDVPELVETDPDDTPIEEVKPSLRRALQQAKSGPKTDSDRHYNKTIFSYRWRF